MKRFYTFFVVCLALSCWVNVANAQIARIPDTNLAAAIRDALNLAPGRPIPRREMSELKKIEAEDVNDLTGLEHATQLTELDLLNHRISDLGPLENLTNLTSLDLTGNGQFTDLRPLENLTNLTSLGLTGNERISDFTVLADLPNLTSLFLFFAKIDNRDLTSISMLTNLTTLGLGANEISDISPLAKLTNLTWLSLWSNKITDISPLAKLTNLTWLAVRENPIQDLSPLTSLTKLRDLDVELPVSQEREEGLIPDLNLAAAIRERLGLGPGANITKQAMQRLTELTAYSRDIRNLAGLEHATQLEVLGLGWNEIQDIMPLAKLTQLRLLFLQVNKITNISPLANLRYLEELHIGWNRIADISPLASLTRLVSLNLEANNIREISVIGRLVRLESLNLHQTPISRNGGDLSPLRNLGQLKSLGIRVNQLSDISRHVNLAQLESLNLRWSRGIDLDTLARFTQLKSLDLWDNREIRDIRQLAKLTQLESLELGSNKISDVTPLANLTQLRELGLSRNQISDVIPLAKLVNLEVLRLEGNPIQDASPLANLTKLRSVDIDIPKPPPVSGGVIPDPNLAAAVRSALGLAPNAPIAKEAMQKLTNLDARDREIKNLTGLEHATQLRELFLYDNQIRNLTPLAGLTQLKRLGLDRNQISNIRPLTGLTQLELLHIGRNQIKNNGVQLLTSLKRLKWLSLYRNQIGNITPLAKLTKLEGLWLSNNKIRDVSPLAGLVNLQTLHLNGNPIQDFSPLVSLTKLSDVDVEILQTSVPATGTWLAVLRPSGLAAANFTIGPGEFALLVPTNQKADTGSADYNTYRLGRTITQNSVDTDFPNLVHFFRNGGRIELVSHASFNPLPRNTRKPKFGDVVISEIMWGLNGSARGKQYIELYNASGDTYTFIDGNLIVRFSTTAEEPLPVEKFPLPTKPDAHVKVIDRVSNKGWNVPGKSGNTSQNKPLISMYRTIDYITGNIPDGTLASSWEESTGRVNLPPPSYGTPGAKDLPPTPVVQVESPEHAPMYWINTNNGTLYRLVGTEVENLIPSVRNATNLAIDAANEKLYWTEQTSKTTGKIRRANLNGTNVQLVKNLTSIPQGIALDTTNGKIYLTNAWGKIQRLNVDGSNFQPNFITGLDAPKGLALDVSSGKIYWTETAGHIRRANLDGSNVEDVATGLGTPINIAIFDNTVYWTEKIGENSGEIRFVNLQGNVVTRNSFTQGFPVGIAVDAVERTLYWTTSRGIIGRQALDGSNFQPNFVTGLSAPGTLALRVETPVDVETPVVAATDAVLSISPSSVVSPAIGEQLTFNLNIAAGEAVAGYQVTLQFDPTALRYVESSNGDYLPTGAFFVQPVVNRDRVELASAALTGVSNGDGTLATITFEVIAVKASTLTLSETLLAGTQGNTFLPQVEVGEITEPPELKADVNGDGMVNIQDLVLVASSFGQTGQNSADVNADGVVNIADLVLVAGGLSAAAGAPSLHAESLEMLTAVDVHEWLSQAHQLNNINVNYQRGVLVLEQLLAALTPKETTLLSNYPNPFNPETWIPYQLANASDVKITIYDTRGIVVRQLALGHQPPGFYTDRSRAGYWDGRNVVGERVASGIYFYQLQTDNVSLLRKMLILK